MSFLISLDHPILLSFAIFIYLASLSHSPTHSPRKKLLTFTFLVNIWNVDPAVVAEWAKALPQIQVDAHRSNFYKSESNLLEMLYGF